MNSLDEKIAKLVKDQHAAKNKAEDDLARAKEAREAKEAVRRQAQGLLMDEVYPHLNSIAAKISAAGGNAHVITSNSSTPGDHIVTINFFKKTASPSFPAGEKWVAVSYKPEIESFIFVSHAQKSHPNLLVSEYNNERLADIVMSFI